VTKKKGKAQTTVQEKNWSKQKVEKSPSLVTSHTQRMNVVM
jgi:hypothetical protein